METIWTRERCAEEAAKYKTRTEFCKGSCTAYEHALENGWIEDYDWMEKKTGIYKDPDKCREAASQYKTRTEFLRGNRAAYRSARNNGWLDSYDWMPKPNIKKRTTWNEDTCREAAVLCKNAKDFSNSFPAAYEKAVYCGWIDSYTWFERPQVHNKKWDEDTCREAALQCKSRTEFKKKFHRAYEFASKNKFINTYHWFEEYMKPDGWWDDPDHVREESKRYFSITDFAKGSQIAYKNAVRNGWIDEYTWLTRSKKSKGWWNDYDKCFNAAKLYSNEYQMKKHSITAYKYAKENGWIKDYYWFEPVKVRYSRGYWNDKERVTEVAKGFITRGDFQKKYPSAYKYAIKNGWMDDFYWFGEKIDLKNGKIDQVYAYEFVNEHAVYVGRTLMQRAKTRDWEHIFKDKDAVYNFAKEHDIAIPEMKVLEDNLTLEDGIRLEGVYVEKYRQEGWQILNRAKTGSIGGLFNRLTKKKCIEKSKLCSSIEEFKRKYPGEHRKSKEKGWIDQFNWLK